MVVRQAGRHLYMETGPVTKTKWYVELLVPILQDCFTDTKSKTTQCAYFMGYIVDNNSAISWWRHQMETFSALLAICAGNSPVPGEFPSQRPVTRSFDVYFDLRPNERLSKQVWGWWFETPSSPLWRHRNDSYYIHVCDNVATPTRMWRVAVTVWTLDRLLNISFIEGLRSRQPSIRFH